jgi:DHA1 family bicyclomycin/chloramphenicol resistance-like MFS transporter
VTRVLVVAMVRDLFDGEAMARVMSLVFMVFMLVPVLGPTLARRSFWSGRGGRSSGCLPAMAR